MLSDQPRRTRFDIGLDLNCRSIRARPDLVSCNTNADSVGVRSGYLDALHTEAGSVNLTWAGLRERNRFCGPSRSRNSLRRLVGNYRRGGEVYMR
jgi:hypothetical protein